MGKRYGTSMLSGHPTLPESPRVGQTDSFLNPFFWGFMEDSLQTQLIKSLTTGD